MEYNLYLVDAFTDESFKGNPACVIPDARRLSGKQMQNIASEINVAETAFVTLIDRETYKIRFFSPYGEVGFCGHSTVAIFYILALRGYIVPIEVGMKTMNIISNDKRLVVDIYFLDYEIANVVVKMGTPELIKDIEDMDSILELLNLKQSDLDLKDEFKSIPIIKLYSKYGFIPIKEKHILDSIEIDKEGLMSKFIELGIDGLHLFHLPKENSDIVYTRNFTLMGDLIEEPATGTANGALVYLLKQRKLIKENVIQAIQGEAMGRISHINCIIEEEEGIYKVEIGGKGKVIMEGIIHV